MSKPGEFVIYSETSNWMSDVRGIDIEVGDTVSAAVYKEGGCVGQEIGVVKSIDYLNQNIVINDDEPIYIHKSEVLVLPDEYKDW